MKTQLSTTDELIASLATNVTPVAFATSAWRLAAGIAAGALLAFLGIVLIVGAPFAAVATTGIAAFAMKLSYAIAMTVLAASLLHGAGRPGQHTGLRHVWLLLPPLVVGAVALLEQASAPPQAAQGLFFGSSWQACLASVTLMSVPVFVGLLWSFRRLAPTQLWLAGGLAGLASGAAASVVYALYCPETSASFLISWYTLGMALAASAGALVGPKLLRW
jgi:hypothetical protein